MIIGDYCYSVLSGMRSGRQDGVDELKVRAVSYVPAVRSSGA
jgi:hypothetical protein